MDWDDFWTRIGIGFLCLCALILLALAGWGLWAWLGIWVIAAPVVVATVVAGLYGIGWLFDVKVLDN